MVPDDLWRHVPKFEYVVRASPLFCEAPHRFARLSQLDHAVPCPWPSGCRSSHRSGAGGCPSLAARVAGKTAADQRLAGNAETGCLVLQGSERFPVQADGDLPVFPGAGDVGVFDGLGKIVFISHGVLLSKCVDVLSGLRFCRLSGGKNADDRFGPTRTMTNHQQARLVAHADDDEAFLLIGMIRIGDGQGPPRHRTRFAPRRNLSGACADCCGFCCRPTRNARAGLMWGCGSAWFWFMGHCSLWPGQGVGDGREKEMD